jgi:hypothetical protein
MNKPVTEAELKARAVGQRVTLEDVENAIIAEHYFTASDGVFGAKVFADSVSPNPAAPATHALLTFCVLTLWNGYTVTGQSACADPANYKKDIGDRIARQDAVNKIWPLLGYVLRSSIMTERLMVQGAEVEPHDGMTPYIGTKLVNAIPCMRCTYNQLRGWTTPADEDPQDQGYLIEYTDRALDTPIVLTINDQTLTFKGYISWSPKDVFERAYAAVGEAAVSAANEAAAAAGATGEQPDLFEETVYEGVGVLELPGKVIPVEALLEKQEATWQDRLIEERHEMAERLLRLDAFRESAQYRGLDKDDQRDLDEQASFMRGYVAILNRRLKKL